MLRNKKGVSPVIAVVLMIVVAVAISLVVYVWASGFVSEKTGAESKAGDYSFLVETKDVNSTNIRNTGTAISPMDGTDATTDFWNAFDLYVNNALKPSPPSAATVTLHDTNSNNVWDKGEVITIDFNTDASAGDKIKLVHKDSGTPIVFKLE
ncbi:hypothetical protein DRN50_08780 [Thermococci archaeon]|nr:MAG: hypothetical protein DRN50_08780 [Thermococci archaeon]